MTGARIKNKRKMTMINSVLPEKCRIFFALKKA
jgi:hypothetical protein